MGGRSDSWCSPEKSRVVVVFGGGTQQLLTVVHALSGNFSGRGFLA